MPLGMDPNPEKRSWGGVDCTTHVKGREGAVLGKGERGKGENLVGGMPSLHCLTLCTDFLKVAIRPSVKVLGMLN